MAVHDGAERDLGMKYKTVEELRQINVDAIPCASCGFGVYLRVEDEKWVHVLETNLRTLMCEVDARSGLQIDSDQLKIYIPQKARTLGYGRYEQDIPLRFSFSQIFSPFVAKQIHVGDIFEVSCIQSLLPKEGVMANLVFIGNAQRKQKRSRINRLLDWTLRGRV